MELLILLMLPVMLLGGFALDAATKDDDSAAADPNSDPNPDSSPDFGPNSETGATERDPII